MLGHVECVEALDELLEHELLHVGFIRVEDLVPDKEEASTIEFNVFGVAYVH